MRNYKLSNEAKEDLRRIYIYGYQHFGEAAADSYFGEFCRVFESIARNPQPYQSVDHIRPGYRRCICGADSNYYRVSDFGIEIMAILGGQDTDHWL
ncbi:MAG: toxin ParE1/3/4 [Paraglaciecola sp.]|jgi:toxin ParE1/3/4